MVERFLAGELSIISGHRNPAAWTFTPLKMQAM